MTRALINLAPLNYVYKTASQMPESQLQMIVPRALWLRVRAYIPHFEAVHLAGRFGADLGDYEWELLDQPHGLKWWRRTTMGDAAYCAAILAPDPNLDPVEAFGVIDIASDTPWWFDAVMNIGLIQGRGEAFAREHKISVDEGRVLASIQEEYQPHELLTATPDQDGIAWRCGDLAEVTLLKEATLGLINRAHKATLPSEVR